MHKSDYRLKWLVLALMALTLTACGWRLRGSVSLPEQIKKINLIQLANNESFNKRLIKALQTAGTEVVESKVGADASLTILELEQIKKTAAVDSQGRTVAKEITLELAFSLQDKGGKMLVEQENLRRTKIYRHDPDKALAMEREESRVVSGLIDKMISALINRVKYRVKLTSKPQGQQE